MNEVKAEKAPPSASGARRAARLAAVQALYQMEYGQERHEGLHLDDGGGDVAAPDGAVLAAIVRTAQERRADIDEILTKSLSPEWPLARLDSVLRAVLRAGVAELLHDGATPAAILMTDYVDVAHAFFGGKEPGLVNAVLDKVAKILRGA
ncbi:MAG: transcription antitermination factor NusB [Alphaproteobacteria bacterium]